MNVLKCNSYNEFIVIINQQVNEQNGIIEANKRLYHKQTTNYQPKQLKRPPMVKHQKTSKTYTNDISQDQLLNMAWTMKQLDVFNNVKTIAEKQIQFYQKQLNVIDKIQKSSNLIQAARKQLETQDIIQLKAWEIVKIQKQVESIQKRIDKILVSLGVVAQDYEGFVEIDINKTLNDQMLVLESGIRILVRTNSSIKGMNEQYTSSQIQELIDYLGEFANVYQQINNIQEVLLQYPRYLIQQYKFNIAILEQVRHKYNQLDKYYVCNQSNQKILLELINMKVQDITNVLFLTTNLSVSSDIQKQLLNWFLQLETCKKQLSTYDITLNKVIILREKQLNTLTNLYTLIDSKGKFSIPRIIHLFYIKEVQLFKIYPTNLEHLEYLAQSLSQIQQTLQINKQFISNLDLNLTHEKFLQKEELYLLEQNIDNPKIQKTKPDYLQLQKQYIAELQKRNEIISQYREKVSKKGKLKEEYLNLLDRQMQKLKLSKLSTQCTSQVQSKQIKEKQIIVSKHQDILGQMIWIIEDTRYKIFNKEFTDIWQKISGIYDKYFYKQGIPKKIITDIQASWSIIQQYTTQSVNLFRQYKHDPLIAYYLKDNLYFVIKNLKKIDFINYAMHLTITLMRLVQYYDRFDIEWFYKKYSFDLKFFNLEQYLLYMQKYFEITFTRFQKDCDSQLVDQGSFLNMKIQSSANKRQKLLIVMRSAIHAYLLSFEIGRYIYFKWTKRIYLQKNITKLINPDKKLQKYLEAMLKNKLKYFPKLKSIIIPQLRQIEQKVKDQLISKLNDCLYYNWLHDQTFTPMIEQIDNPLKINIRKFQQSNNKIILKHLFQNIEHRDICLEEILVTFQQQQLLENHQQLPYCEKVEEHLRVSIKSIANQEIRLRTFEPDSEIIFSSSSVEHDLIRIYSEKEKTIIDLFHGPKIVAIYLSIPVESPSLQTKPLPSDNNYYQLVVYNRSEILWSNRFVYSQDDF